MVWGLFLLLGCCLVLLVLIGTAVMAHLLTHPPRYTVGTAIARGAPTSPREAGFEYESHGLGLPDGLELALWLVEGRDAQGPVIVMLHGWGEGRIAMLRWLDVLAPIASRLVLFDLRGHGENQSKTFRWGLRETGDVEAVVQWLHAGNMKEIALFGVSIGGNIASRAALRMGARVFCVVRYGPLGSPLEFTTSYLRSRRIPAWPVARLVSVGLRVCGRIPWRDNLFTKPHIPAPPILSFNPRVVSHEEVVRQFILESRKKARSTGM